MRHIVAVLIMLAVTISGCSSGEVDGLGARVPGTDAVRMAKEGSPLVEVTRTDTYTSPLTVYVINGKDKHGRALIVWVYTTVIRYAYADQLIPEEKARAVAREKGFPAEAIRASSLRVFHGSLQGRDAPIFWRLDTTAGWIWIDAETGDVLKRLDAD